jgi:hypothetical protein
MAVASVGIGILGIVFGFAFGLLALSVVFPALMLGIVSLHEIAQSDGEVKGKALAITGIVLGVLGFPSMVITIIF